jgi:hypothetical protein
LRAFVAQNAAVAMRDELEKLIGDTFGLAPAPPVHECYFSIVTTPPEALAPIQRLPHVDGLDPDRIAILIYLSCGVTGGTAFYRQRATGFETLDAERYFDFDAALRAGIEQHGLPPPAYIAGGTPLTSRSRATRHGPIAASFTAAEPCIAPRLHPVLYCLPIRFWAG